MTTLIYSHDDINTDPQQQEVRSNKVEQRLRIRNGKPVGHGPGMHQHSTNKHPVCTKSGPCHQ